MAFTEVILTENIPNLGAEADIVKVRAGYARNFLIPQGFAYETNPTSLRQIERLRAKRAEREARELNDSQELARKINKVKLTFELNVGESGRAFGSVSLNDIAEKLAAELGGKEIEKHRLQLDRNIKETGTFEIPVKLHSDVTAKFTITVVAPVAEAKADEA